jgi:hypothetical protein
LPIESDSDLREVRVNGKTAFLDRFAAINTDKATVVEAELK